MDIALVENNDFLSFLVYEHDWIHILYIGVTATFFLIQLCQRISLDLLYSSSNYSKTVSLSKLVSLVFFLLNKNKRWKKCKYCSITKSLSNRLNSISIQYVMHMVFCLHLAGNLSTNSFIYEEKKTQIVRFFLCV